MSILSALMDFYWLPTLPSLQQTGQPTTWLRFLAASRMAELFHSEGKGEG